MPRAVVIWGWADCGGIRIPPGQWVAGAVAGAVPTTATPTPELAPAPAAAAATAAAAAGGMVVAGAGAGAGAAVSGIPEAAMVGCDRVNAIL
mmetsp:Transcript_25352/g.38524  ORF Transcript_25352/g.38524 Transcript_25352/m.38524 type:complete len:92 (+) Transcript_25352:412-687(+)